MESDGGSPHEENSGISQVNARDKIGLLSLII